MFTVATPETNKALTLLATVKADLGISGTGEDTYLTEKINQASAAVCANLRVPQAADGSMTLAREALVQTFRFEGTGGVGFFPYTGVGASNPRSHLILARKPVTAVTSVVVGSTTLDPSEYEVNGASGLLMRLRSDRPSSWNGCSKIVVSLTAGWLLPDKGASRNLPYDIEKAVVDLVKMARSARKRDPLLKEIEVVDVDRRVYWVGGTPGSSTLPPEIAATLDPWRYVSLAA